MTETMSTGASRPVPAPARQHLPSRRVHPAWWVALVSFVTIVAAAAFSSVPGLLVEPLNGELGWSRGTVGLGISVQLALYGLTAPFAAALMDRFGIRPVLVVALGVVTAGALSTVWMTQPWQLVLGWGLLVGLGTGCMAPAFAATVTSRWFIRRRGLVSGILTAGSASGQLVFLPLLSWMIEQHGWRPASVTIAVASALTVPLVVLWMRTARRTSGSLPTGRTPWSRHPRRCGARPRVRCACC